MSAVACERHGTQPGLLCCDHVREAVATWLPTRSLGNYRFDVLGDGSELLDHILCAECAALFGLSIGELIPEAIWGDERKFPYISPVCEECFLEWRNGLQA